MNTTPQETTGIRREICGIDLHKEITERASAMGMCGRWAEKIDHARNADDLAELYKDGIDFCVMHGWPDKDYLSEHLGKETLSRHHIYFEGNEELKGKGTYIFGGESTIRFSAKRYDAATLHISGKSHVCIEASGHAAVFVRVYDESVVDIHSTENAIVRVIAYGGKCDVRAAGNVEKRYKKYFTSGSRKQVSKKTQPEESVE